MSKFSIFYLLFHHNLCLLWQFMFLFSESHASNQKAQLFLLWFYPALNMVFSKFFHYSAYYFTWHCWCRVQGIFQRNFKDLFPWQNLHKYGNWTLVPDVTRQRGGLIFKGQNANKKWTLQLNDSSLNYIHFKKHTKTICILLLIMVAWLRLQQG